MELTKVNFLVCYLTLQNNYINSPLFKLPLHVEAKCPILHQWTIKCDIFETGSLRTALDIFYCLFEKTQERVHIFGVRVMSHESYTPDLKNQRKRFNKSSILLE